MDEYLYENFQVSGDVNYRWSAAGKITSAEGDRAKMIWKFFIENSGKVTTIMGGCIFLLWIYEVISYENSPKIVTSFLDVESKLEVSVYLTSF